MTDLKRMKNFTFDMTLTTKGILIFILKIFLTFIYMTLNGHNGVAFDLDHDFEGHVKVRNIFMKFTPIFNSEID